MPKKDFVITLPCLGKFCLQRRAGISRIMKIKTRTVISCLFSRLSAELVTFLHLKTKFHRSYILALFTNFSVVAAMLPIMTKLNLILKSECVNTEEFRHIPGKELKVIKAHLLFCNHAPDLENFSILTTNNNDFKVTLIECPLINRNHLPLNKNKQSLPLELFDS